MKKSTFSLLILLLTVVVITKAQNNIVPAFQGATKINRDKTYNYLIKQSITGNLALPLSDSTEESWEEAFYALELINYKMPWIDEKIKIAFYGINKRSIGFQRALMELMYTNYKTEFKTNISKLLLSSTNAKVFAMCAEYLLRANPSGKNIDSIGTIAYNKTGKYFQDDQSSSFIAYELLWPIFQTAEPEGAKTKFNISDLFSSDFLKGNTAVYSIQRKNRNYTGIVLVRDKQGNFIKNDSGNIFTVPQLARSITNMPFYLTNGNTPQGIFRMNGFAVSKSPALGPTENIQLMMPYETSIPYFLKDSSVTDTVWSPELYERLLPTGLKEYHPLFQSYFASAIGRTEVIAHGTTVDPDYYKGQPWYPYTPTQGCLCTKEIWSAVDGKRVISDQQKLVDAVKKAGGPDGYMIVIEIDDQQKPVRIDELLPYLK